jgi:hypothetical protein
MKVKRFSADILSITDEGINNSLDMANNVSSQLLENPYLGNTRGVKRWGGFIKNSTKLIKRKKNELGNKAR